MPQKHLQKNKDNFITDQKATSDHSSVKENNNTSKEQMVIKTLKVLMFLTDMCKSEGKKHFQEEKGHIRYHNEGGVELVCYSCLKLTELFNWQLPSVLEIDIEEMLIILNQLKTYNSLAIFIFSNEPNVNFWGFQK